MAEFAIVHDRADDEVKPDKEGNIGRDGIETERAKGGGGSHNGAAKQRLWQRTCRVCSHLQLSMARRSEVYRGTV